ncbi:helix-turn-helix domain-containing protein [Ralstonia chuxiongensis]|uniref:helix-turn-helix domain-containing protein n=1 Tax=Ralstonia chuxiongensis TaxID=2957504 RepID=UPI003B75C586
MRTNELVSLESLSASQVAKEVGVRLRAERIRRGMSQAEMAERAGLSTRTYRRLEAEGAGTVAALLAVLRVCERLRALQVFLPQAHLPEVRTPLSASTLPRVRRSASRSLDGENSGRDAAAP